MRLARSLVLGLSCILGAVAEPQSDPAARRALEVRVHPALELVTAVARLAGFSEFRQPSSASPYAAAVDAHFAPWSEHAAVKRLRELRARRGVSFDAIPSLAVHLGPPPELAELVPFDAPPERLDPRWGAEAREFVAELRELAAASRAAEFFAGHAELYAETEARLRERLSTSPALPWFDAFFGERAGASYVAIPGLLCGGGAFGVGVRFADGSPERITPVLGCWERDERGVPVFGEQYLPLLVHELAHTYTNPFVDRHAERLAAAGERLFALRPETMRRQGYGTGRTVLYETLVRAAVVRCRYATEDREAAQRQAAEEVAAGFAWVPELARLYGEHELGREGRAGFEELMPRVIELLDRVSAELESAAARAPRLASSDPASGAKDVDPSRTTLVLRFDRAMRDQGWSIVGTAADTPAITGTPSYDAERKVLTIPVRLEPGRTYRFGLNGPTQQGFRSETGEPLEPLRLEFSTRS